MGRRRHRKISRRPGLGAAAAAGTPRHYALTREAKSQREKVMRWGAIGLGLGAAVLLVPALIYVLVQRDAENRSTAKTYLVPGLIVLGIAAVFAVLWAMRHFG